MILALTCALCASEAALVAGSVRAERPALLEEHLSLARRDVPTPPATPLATLALAHDEGSSHGDAHSDHIGPMWIMMGAMMAVMMVGMAVYLMRHESDGPALGPAAASYSPTAVAVPVSRPRGAGG